MAADKELKIPTGVGSSPTRATNIMESIMKEFPEIKPLVVELTAQEVLGLRHIHSHWAKSSGDTPFCDAMSDSFLEKLGGYLKSPGPLWDHPVAKEWYDNREECVNCGEMFQKSLMISTKDHPDFGCDESGNSTGHHEGYLCQECNDDC
jgi:hypothetical protein